MGKAIIILEYEKKEIVVETFGSACETISKERLTFMTMSSLKNFFQEKGFFYNEEISLYKNLESLIKGGIITGYSIKTYMEILNGYKELPDECDIYIED